MEYEKTVGCREGLRGEDTDDRYLERQLGMYRQKNGGGGRGQQTKYE